MENILKTKSERFNNLTSFRNSLRLKDKQAIVNYLLTFVSEGFVGSDYSELTYLYFYNLLDKEQPKCLICGDVCKFHVNRYRDTCGGKECIKQHIKAKIIEKYGGMGHTSDKIKNKIIETNMKRYGAKNVFASDYGKQKIKETCLKRYGVEHNWEEGSICRETCKKTMKELYGIEHNWSKESPFRVNFNNKRLKETKEKYKKIITNNKNYRLEVIDDDKRLVCKCLDCNKTFIVKGVLWTRFYRYSHLKICPFCNPIGTSFSELELTEYIKSIYNGKIINNHRRWSYNRYELDIYLPELKIAFEFNGIHWHSKRYKDKDYHKNKSKYAKDKGIMLIHIFEDDWYLKKDIVKSKIKECLGVYDVVVNEITTKAITNKQAKSFLDRNHLHGYIESEYHFGCFYKNELVSVMSIDKNEIVRYCDKKGYKVDSFKKFFENYNNLIRFYIIDLDYQIDYKKVENYMDIYKIAEPKENDFGYFNSGFLILMNNGFSK